MEDALGFFVVLLALSGFGVWLWNRRRRERLAAEERQRVREEQRRLEGCGEVVRFFHNYLGYIAKEAIRRDELEALVDAGATGEDLAKEICLRIAEKDGIVLGYQTLDGARVDVKLTEANRERHVYIVGKTGSGKTNLLRNMILQDIERGDGVGVVAPEAEMLSDEILPYIPEGRIDDVIYFDPSDTERPVAFNPLHLDEDEDIDLRADEVYTIFRRIAGDGGPRMNEILRHTIYALLEKPGTTFLDVPRLLDPRDDDFRKEVISASNDEDTIHFFRDVYPSFPKDAHLPIVTRFGQFLRPRYVRNVLCQPESSFDFREAMDSGKILLFSLSDGVLGEGNSALLGQLLVSKIQIATMSRANVSKERRRPFRLYLDEFQRFVDVNATSYEALLSRARKYRLALTLAHQNTSQIPLSLLHEIFGNVAAIVSFVVSHDDAMRLSKEFLTDFDGEIDHLPPEAFLNLRVGEAVCRMGRSTFPMRTTLADQRPDRRRAALIIERSRQNYGVAPAERGIYRPATAGTTAESLEEVAFQKDPTLDKTDPFA